ncbi:hypothetical protein CWI75_13240 [Kineobactrum sediminis]|uniref:DUF3445 domain-containing protein n=1 Tax=Kineobactrum sediminis TaxID=1905677 RepID=A0A2N5Y0Y5_9GAMM|nr:DUF3445 domain-containing protein [Kineobactrum sediminis]PLW82041.1 hypothetical protein CWI75_13240 [Kineobactrum sediminis]
MATENPLTHPHLRLPLRYLPHMRHPDVLTMGLAPLSGARWIEPDVASGEYHLHKLRQRERLGDNVYQALPDSMAAQRELAGLLAAHLLNDHSEHYRQYHDQLECISGNFIVPLDTSANLWRSSLWIADDLVIMEPQDDNYVLTAASLCSPSHWRLEEKFGQTLTAIHQAIPGFSRELEPKVTRFFAHLRVGSPVTRFNWSLQPDTALCQRPGEQDPAVTGEPGLCYRVERQSLRRLPVTGAIVFTIRVYLHPLGDLLAVPGALTQLLAAIDNCPRAIYEYKGFDGMERLLQPWRERAGRVDSEAFQQ